MNKLKHSLVLAGLLAAPAGVMAAEPAPSPHTITANVGLYSQYVFRGITQTGEDPALQGGMDYAHTSGFYVGVWGSNVSWLEDYQGYSKGSLEIDIYAGFRNSIGNTGLTYDLGILRYQYPGDRPPGITNANTTELYAALGWKWFTAKYSHSISDETFGFANSRGSSYIDLSASVPIAETGLTAGVHWGKQDYDGSANDPFDYEDWKVSLTYDLGKISNVTKGMTLGVAYTDTNAARAAYTDANGLYMGDSQTTVWISKTF